MDGGRLFHTAGWAWLNTHSPKTVLILAFCVYTALLADQSLGQVMAATVSGTLSLM